MSKVQNQGALRVLDRKCLLSRDGWRQFFFLREVISGMEAKLLCFFKLGKMLLTCGLSIV